jgi:hypothetical protein
LTSEGLSQSGVSHIRGRHITTRMSDVHEFPKGHEGIMIMIELIR